MRWNRLIAKLSSFLRRDHAEREMAREIGAHLALIEDEFLRDGLPPAEARLAARRAFGGVEQARELHRGERSFASLERFIQDLRHAWRGLARTPGFTLTAILTLALGLGSATAMFSIVNGVLLLPLKYRDPRSLFVARTIPPPSAQFAGDFPVNARHFHEWRTHCTSCEQAALAQYLDLTLVGAGEPVRLPALSLSYNFFRTLAINPALGRDPLGRALAKALRL